VLKSCKKLIDKSFHRRGTIMAIKRSTKTRTVRTTDLSRNLADRLGVARSLRAYALPYHTVSGTDTEYLISNSNAKAVKVTFVVFGKKCKIAKKQQFTLNPNCTKSLRLRAIVPEHAGHTILTSTADLVAHILYLRQKDVAVVGGELAGQDNLFAWLRQEKSRTYGFGYRALALGHDRLDGAVFVSNPNSTALIGKLVFYDQQCRATRPRRVAVKPGCTARYPFPNGRYGYGRIQVSSQAVINVLHFAASSKGIAAAELVGEANKLQSPPIDPKPRSKILFDDTHGCRPGVTGDWTDYEAALVSTGYTVAHHTAPSVILTALKRHDVFVIAIARSSYSALEKKAISDFVNQGGGLLVVQDFGNAPWSVPTREILNLFGANDDNNFIHDPTNNVGGQIDDVIFDYQRNFLAHPITNGWKYFHVDAAASLSGGAGWNTIVETDDDSVPARRPVVIARAFGAGRIVAFGDTNTWANHLINHLENKHFGIRCAEWLLFKI